jgi:hypothetical protein
MRGDVIVSLSVRRRESLELQSRGICHRYRGSRVGSIPGFMIDWISECQTDVPFSYCYECLFILYLFILFVQIILTCLN